LPDDVDGVFGIGIADCITREDNGGGVGVDEPGDAAYVDFVGRVLFGIAVSGGDSAGGEGAAADSGN